MERDQVAKRLEEVMLAAKNFMEIADVPTHLRNNSVYSERRAALNTVASLKLHELLPAEDAQLAYITLAKEAQTLLVLLDEGIPELHGVTRRGQLRDSVRRLNALVGKALPKDKA